MIDELEGINYLHLAGSKDGYGQLNQVKVFGGGPMLPGGVSRNTKYLDMNGFANCNGQI